VPTGQFSDRTLRLLLDSSRRGRTLGLLLFADRAEIIDGLPRALGHRHPRDVIAERAAREIGLRIDLSDSDIRSALEQGDNIDFERTELYRRVFALADQTGHAPQPRALLPRIALESPKITRKLTTEWFATRVEKRYRACLDKGP